MSDKKTDPWRLALIVAATVMALGWTDSRVSFHEEKAKARLLQQESDAQAAKIQRLESKPAASTSPALDPAPAPEPTPDPEPGSPGWAPGPEKF